MYILTDKQFQTQVEPILRKIFIDGDPYSESFLPQITQKIILYPCHEVLEIKTINALVKGASVVKDTGCYLSFLWEFGTERNNCYIPLSELLEFYTCSSERAKYIDIQLTYSPEYILFSEKAKWGLIVSHEYYGLLGGSSKFMATFKQNYPDYDKQVNEFLQNYCLMKDSGISLTLDWLPRLLTYVYGQEAAEKILREYELL